MIGFLVELYAWLHSNLCFSLLEKLFLSNLDTSSTPSYLSSFYAFSYRNLDRSLIARWINRENSWILDSLSTAGGSIELLFLCLCFVPRHLLDSCICQCCFSRHLPRQMSWHLATPLSVEIYWTSIYRFYAIWFFISLDLSLDSFVFSLPKPPSLTPNFFLKVSSSFY